ncbi:MAG: rhodanese-like domain-containing protein [Gallionellaceae bacterium]
MRVRFFLIWVLLALSVSNSFAASDNFPLRKKYSSVPTISLKELQNQYNNVIIVDVRSTFEFDVIHVLKAENALLSNRAFLSNLEKIRPKHGTIKIVFYCNGYTCKKSYEATQKAMAAGFGNVFAFDAGIFEWAQAQADKTALLGKSPLDPSKLISRSGLDKKMISYRQLKAKQGRAVLIDIRDPFQRDFSPKISGLRHVPLDRLKILLAKGQFKDKEIIFIDAVGKQVRWLQYYLQNYGYEKYSFLKHGMKAFPRK